MGVHGVMAHTAAAQVYDVAVGYKMKVSIIQCDEDEEHMKQVTLEHLENEAQRFVEYQGAYLSDRFLLCWGRAAEDYADNG